MRSHVLFFLFLCCCAPGESQSPAEVRPGAYQTDEYLGLLSEKQVGLVVNHGSLVQGTHLVDTLLASGVSVHTVFTPEHGFSGRVSDGEYVEYGSSEKNAYQLVSLYGKNKRPTPAQMGALDVVLFDIQDVGARFYTYLSTMHFLMEACAERGIPFVVLDRPNPNGSYVDGPVLDTAFRSFVGMHPIPIVYGMSIGELALMINGEGWLKGGAHCDLHVIPIKNWTHHTPYSLPVRPSPNLPNDLSIALYPSLCLLEGTVMSVGRGTAEAFQQVGHPQYPDTTHSFVPHSWEGSKWPPYENERCYGVSWVGTPPVHSFSLRPLMQAYQQMKGAPFFKSYLSQLAGTDRLRVQLESGMTAEEIRASWTKELSAFKEKRQTYLIYQ